MPAIMNEAGRKFNVDEVDGVSRRHTMQLSGHRTSSVFERYNVTSEGDLREAARKLTGQFRAQSGHRPPPWRGAAVPATAT